MTKHANNKPKYESPVVIKLGELASAAGVECGAGTGPLTGACNPGTDGFASCGPGTTAKAACNIGEYAGANCAVGDSGPT